MPDMNGKWLSPYLTQLEEGPVRNTFDSLSRYLGGWQDDSGRNPIVNNEQAGFGGTRGNATVKSFYKVTGDECWWCGGYLLGSTTAWAAVALQLFAPFPANLNEMVPSTVGGLALGGVKAYNGTPYFGAPDIGLNSGPNGGALINPYTSGGAFWTNTVPFTWANTSQLVWSVRYRISPTVRR
jgi:hypothetical protein